MKPYVLCFSVTMLSTVLAADLKPYTLDDVWTSGLPAGNLVYRTLMSSLWKNCTAYKDHLGLELNITAKSHTSKLTLELWHKAKIPYINDQISIEPTLILKEVFGMFGARQKLLHSPHYKSNLPMTIFIHGFRSNSDSEAPRNVARILVARGDRNVLVLNSGRLISVAYIRSTHYSYLIGNELGKLLSYLYKDGVKPGDVQLIGHSLGAHIAGFTGKTFKALTGVKIARITALDPAGPCFSSLSPNLRLSSDDADFVDVIHTNAGAYGYFDPIGDVDFYPNKGEEQPGCPLSSCSHERSWKLYVESVTNPNAFPSVRCDSWSSFILGKCNRSAIVLMGFRVDSIAKGTYYLRTGASPPYGLGTKGIEMSHPAINFIRSLIKTVHK